MLRKGLSNEKLAAGMVSSFGLGCRLIAPGKGYLKSLTKPNVHVVHDSVVPFTKAGIVDSVPCCGLRNGVRGYQFGDQPVEYISILVEHFPQAKMSPKTCWKDVTRTWHRPDVNEHSSLVLLAPCLMAHFFP